MQISKNITCGNSHYALSTNGSGSTSNSVVNVLENIVSFDLQAN